MKPMTLNMSKMKKIAGDKSTSTFKHDDGHEIKILHTALPALQRKQLEKLPIHKMADGGDIDDQNPQPNPTPGPDNVPIPQDVIEMGKKAFASNYSDGGPVVHRGNNPKLQQSIVRNPVPENQTKVLPHYDSGTPSVDPADAMQPAPASVYGNQSANAQVQPVPQAPQTLNPNGLLNAPSAYNLQQQAGREQQAVDQAKGAAQANLEAGYNKQRAAIAQQDADAIRQLKSHTDDFKDYITQNPIDPKHYQENMGSGQKVTTAIGLALGGFGNGFNGRGNPAMDFLNKQIDRDIAAQQSRGEQQKSVWSAYQHLYDNQSISSNLAKVSMNDLYTHKMNQVAAQMATPQAKAIADAFGASKAMENNQLLLNASQNAGIETANPGQPGAQTNPNEVPSVPYIDQNGKAQGVSSQSSQPEQPQKSMQGSVPGFTPEHVLSPDALKKINQADIAKLPGWSDLGETRDQATTAQQLEKAFNGPKGDGKGSIDDYFNQMYQNSGQGSYIKGAGGALQRGGSKVTNAISHLVGGRATDLEVPAYSEATKAYQDNYQNLKTMLGSTLKGLISVADLDRMVGTYSPGFGDTEKDIAKKKEDFKNELRRALKTSSLETHKLLAKPKQ